MQAPSGNPCPSCGQNNEPGVKFCRFCGTKMGTVGVTAVASEAFTPSEPAPEPVPQQAPPANSWTQPGPQTPQNPPYDPSMNNQWQQPGPAAPVPPVNPDRPWEQMGPNNQWQQPGPNQWNPNGPNQWNGPQTPNNNTPGKKGKQGKNGKNGKKTSPVFVILIVLFSLIILALLFLIIWVFVLGRPFPGLSEGEESSHIETSVNPDDSSYLVNSGDENSSGESSDSQMNFTHDSSNSQNDGDSSNSSAGESSQESSESSIPEPTSFTLSCGAEVPFDATTLDLTGYNVTDLVGIEQAPNLQTLTITQGTITDLSPLTALSGLSSITLNNLPISDISALSALPNLTYLNVKDTMLTADTLAAIKALKPGLTIVGYTVSEYQLVAADVTWEEANYAANQAGGHLVTITSEEEYNKIVKLLGDTKLMYIWLGARSTNGTFAWVTNEEFSYTKWYEGEPSGKDMDGTVEDCLCLWHVTSEWTENDQRNALNSVNGTSGKIGYIIETERVWGYQP